jgi:hypothetical protein
MRPRTCLLALTIPLLLGLATACGDDDNGGTPADLVGVGAQCRTDGDCLQPSDAGIAQRCLTQFKGGYCGLQDCARNADCPAGSACVLHDDGQTYCFRHCVEKSECNSNRAPEVESNCVSNIDFVEEQTPGKACVPPSSG